VEQVDSQAEVIAMLRILESSNPAQEVGVKQVVTEAGGAAQWKLLYGRQSKRRGEWKNAIRRLRKSLSPRLWLDVEV
jgi:hypothetical protein